MLSNVGLGRGTMVYEGNCGFDGFKERCIQSLTANRGLASSRSII